MENIESNQELSSVILFISITTITSISSNTINGHKVINDYSQKISAICCHAYRLNPGR